MFNGPIPAIYSRPSIPIMPAVPFVPVMPRPVVPIFGGCCAPFQPMITPMAAAPLTFGFPFMACGNIFIQNMIITAARVAQSYRQQAAMMAQIKAQNNYQFGSLTARSNFTPANFSGRTVQPAINQGNSFGNSFWERMGYSFRSGLNLARTAMSRAVGFTGYCARYVKNAIASCGLGSYVSGNAHDMIRILRNNKNFREIPAHGVNPRTLTPGCILVYERGVSGYSSQYGHTEITTGDGRAVSDGITNNVRGNVTAIFMPVA